CSVWVNCGHNQRGAHALELWLIPRRGIDRRICYPERGKDLRQAGCPLCPPEVTAAGVHRQPARDLPAYVSTEPIGHDPEPVIDSVRVLVVVTDQTNMGCRP